MKSLKYSVVYDENGKLTTADSLEEDNIDRGKKYYVFMKNLETKELDKIEVVPVLSKTRRKHFRCKLSRNELIYKYVFEGSGESELHKYCVRTIADIIRESGGFCTPEKMFKTCLGKRIVQRKDIRISEDYVECEHTIETDIFIENRKLKSDIFCVGFEDRKEEEVEYALEIVLSHDIEDETLELYRALGINVIRICINRKQLEESDNIKEELKKIVKENIGWFWANCDEENQVIIKYINKNKKIYKTDNSPNFARYDTYDLHKGGRFWTLSNNHTHFVKNNGDEVDYNAVIDKTCIVAWGSRESNFGPIISEEHCKKCTSFVCIDKNNKLHCLGKH